jgi:hypothetical protein
VISKTPMLTLTDRERRIERWPRFVVLPYRQYSGGMDATARVHRGAGRSGVAGGSTGAAGVKVVRIGFLVTDSLASPTRA